MGKEKINRSYLINVCEGGQAGFETTKVPLPNYLNSEILFRYWRMCTLWGEEIDDDSVKWLLANFCKDGPICKIVDNRVAGGHGGMTISVSGYDIMLKPKIISLENKVLLLCEDVPIVTTDNMVDVVEHIENIAKELSLWDGKSNNVHPVSKWPRKT